jgi:hypothetical protein
MGRSSLRIGAFVTFRCSRILRVDRSSFFARFCFRKKPSVPLKLALLEVLESELGLGLGLELGFGVGLGFASVFSLPVPASAASAAAAAAITASFCALCLCSSRLCSFTCICHMSYVVCHML